MNKMLTIHLFCLALLLPGVAPAKKPGDQSAAECAVLIADGLQDGIYPGSPFTVKVNRIPGYPGSWHDPDVTITVTYPQGAGDETYHTIIRNFYVIYFKHTFVVPVEASGGGNAVIDATVREPLVKGKRISYRETVCSRTVPVMYQ
jgi:hypothetical protein